MDMSQRATNPDTAVVQGVPTRGPSSASDVNVSARASVPPIVTPDQNDGVETDTEGEPDLDTKDNTAQKASGYNRRFSFSEQSNSFCESVVSTMRGAGCTNMFNVPDVWARRVAGALFGGAWLVVLLSWVCAPPNQISVWMAVCAVAAHVALNSIPHNVMNSESARDKSVTMFVLFVAVVVELLQCVVALAGDGSGDGAPGALFGSMMITSTFMMRLLPLGDARVEAPETLDQTYSRVVVVLAAIGGVVATCLYAVAASGYPGDPVWAVFPPQGVAIGGWFGLVILGRTSPRSMAATWLEFWPAMSYVFLLGWPLVLHHCGYLHAQGSLACWVATLFQIGSARLASMVTPSVSGSRYGSMTGSMMW